MDGKTMEPMESLARQASELYPIFTVLQFALIHPQSVIDNPSAFDPSTWREVKFPFSRRYSDALVAVLGHIARHRRESVATTKELLAAFDGSEHEEIILEALMHSEEFAGLAEDEPDPLLGVNYAEKLKHPRWQRRRLEILSRDDFTCTRCGETEITLHVHHKRYERNRNPWDYPDDALETLCANCHGAEHK